VNPFKRFGVAARLGLGFGVVIALMLTMLLAGLSRMAMMQANLEGIVREDYAKITLLNKMRDAVRFRGIAMRDVVLQDEFGFKREESKRMREAREAYKAADAALAELVRDPEGQGMLEAIRATESKAADLIVEVMNAALSEDTATAQALIRDSVRGQQRALIGQLDAMLAKLEEQSVTREKEASEAYALARVVMLAVGGLALLVGSLVAWRISRGLTSRLARAAALAQRISEGDLTGEVTDRGADEVAQLLRSLNQMNRGLAGIIRQTADASHQVTGSAGDLFRTIQEVSRLTDGQTEQVVQISAAMEEMGTSIAQVASDASSVAGAANQAREVAQEGNRNMQQSVEATARIEDSVSRSSIAIDELRAEIVQISQVTKVIREIADQTNLLALNAAIEAARAGEQGRGFAVVADEVRTLAERTSSSTLTITETVNSVGAKTARVVDAMAQVRSDVRDNAQVSETTRKLLGDIVTAASDVNRLIQHIADATREQTNASHSTAMAMEKISQISESNSARMHDIEHAASSLTGTSDNLRELVGRFRLA
jgi:methyl-accepting chemotaxis protein